MILPLLDFATVEKSLLIYGIALTFEDRKDFEITDEYLDFCEAIMNSQKTLAASSMLDIIK